MNYKEKRNLRVNKLYKYIENMRDKAVTKPEDAELLGDVVCELSYRKMEEPEIIDGVEYCPKCECPMPKNSYDSYCGFCGQFIRRRQPVSDHKENNVES